MADRLRVAISPSYLPVGPSLRAQNLLERNEPEDGEVSIMSPSPGLGRGNHRQVSFFLFFFLPSHDDALLLGNPRLNLHFLIEGNETTTYDFSDPGAQGTILRQVTVVTAADGPSMTSSSETSPRTRTN